MVIKRPIRLREGQAFMELALGMLALALVTASLFAFAMYILRSLDIHRCMRAQAGVAALGSGGGEGTYSSKTAGGTVDLEPLAANYIFGTQEVEIREEVHIPATGGLLR